MLAKVSNNIEVGARIQSRYRENYWATFWDMAVHNGNIERPGLFKLRGSWADVRTPDWLKGIVDKIHIGSSDLAMFSPYTIGRLRYIDRDNAARPLPERQAGQDGQLRPGAHQPAVALGRPRLAHRPAPTTTTSCTSTRITPSPARSISSPTTSTTSASSPITPATWRSIPPTRTPATASISPTASRAPSSRPNSTPTRSASCSFRACSPTPRPFTRRRTIPRTGAAGTACRPRTARTACSS